MMAKLLLLILSFSIFNFTVAGQNKIVPILETRLGGLVGGVRDGRFVDAKTVFGLLKGNQKYTIFGTNGKIGEMTAEIESPDVPCEDFFTFKTETKDFQGIAVGANASWNLTPRNVKTIDLKNAEYVKAVSAALRTKGIVNANPKIRQALRVDLDGDGREEVLLTATSYETGAQPRAKKGDYSFVLLRKIIGGKVQNLIVTGDFVTKNIDFGAPGKYDISSIADLDGDGKMEIIIYGAYYEGNWIEVFETKSNKPAEIKVLAVGCGV